MPAPSKKAQLAARAPIREHHSTRRVLGLDIREDTLEAARKKAFAAGLPAVCWFASSTSELAEIVISIDAFEHFGDPAEILRIMNSLAQPAEGGRGIHQLWAALVSSFGRRPVFCFPVVPSDIQREGSDPLAIHF